MKTTSRYLSLFPALVAAAFAVGSAQAVVIASYNFESQTTASTDTESNTTASNLNIANIPGFEINSEHTNRQSTGDSLTFDSPVSGFALVGAFGDIKSGSNSLAGALGKNQYVGFTITLNAATTIDLTSFDFATDITNGTAAKNWWLLADVAGGTFTSADEIGSGSFAANESELITSFSTSSFSSNTEFRLYFDTGASTATHGVAIDNITLEANVTPIPEPSAALLGGLGFLALLRRRR